MDYHKMALTEVMSTEAFECATNGKVPLIKWHLLDYHSLHDIINFNLSQSSISVDGLKNTFDQ